MEEVFYKLKWREIQESYISSLQIFLRNITNILLNLEDLKLSTHPFPVHVFPSLIRNAIYEVERQTQAPLSLISASALGAISLVCQNRIDVCRLNGLCSPVSLFLLTLAE